MVLLQVSHENFEEKGKKEEEGGRKKKRKESPLPLNPGFATVRSTLYCAEII
jgi:hypothetical protein